MQKITENWKPIPGYEGSYAVSDFGNVRSIRRNKNLTLLNSIGYRQVVLSVGNNQSRLLVHRLVIDAFQGLKTGFVIDHINANRADNRLENLRQVTVRQNLTFTNVNRKRKEISLTGMTGVWKNGNGYSARIYIKGKGTVYLGIHKTAELAHEKYKKAIANENFI